MTPAKSSLNLYKRKISFIKFWISQIKAEKLMWLVVLHYVDKKSIFFSKWWYRWHYGILALGHKIGNISPMVTSYTKMWLVLEVSRVCISTFHLFPDTHSGSEALSSSSPFLDLSLECDNCHYSSRTAFHFLSESVPASLDSIIATRFSLSS